MESSEMTVTISDCSFLQSESICPGNSKGRRTRKRHSQDPGARTKKVPKRKPAAAFR